MAEKYSIQDLETRNKKLPKGTYVTIHDDSEVPDGTLAKFLGLIPGCDYADFEVFNHTLDSTSSDNNTTTLFTTAYVQIADMYIVQELHDAK